MIQTRITAATLGGTATALLAPALPYAGVCTMMVVADMVTAWTLSRRVARKHPDRAARNDAGKLQSRGLGKMLVTLTRVYALLLMAMALDAVLLPEGGGRILRFCAGAVCFWQAISVLENESSCSDARWARAARRYLVDKARRHLQ